MKYCKQTIEALVDDLNDIATKRAQDFIEAIADAHLIDGLGPYIEGEEMLDEHEDLLERATRYAQGFAGKTI